MQGLRKTVCARCLVAVLFLQAAGCATPYQTHLSDFLAGRESLRKSDYTEAQRVFESAVKAFPSAGGYAFLAVTFYKLGDTASAANALDRARQFDAYGTYHLRIVGYTALIAVKEERPGSKETLKAYLDYYRLCQPLMSIDDVAAMANGEYMPLPLLESTIDLQIRTYENDVEQYEKFHTGFYDRFSRTF